MEGWGGVGEVDDLVEGEGGCGGGSGSGRGGSGGGFGWRVGRERKDGGMGGVVDCCLS